MVSLIAFSEKSEHKLIVTNNQALKQTIEAVIGAGSYGIYDLSELFMAEKYAAHRLGCTFLLLRTREA